MRDISRNNGYFDVSGRRGFLGHSLQALGGGLLLPSLLPASALGRDGGVAPSNRIKMGLIGLGSQGCRLVRNHILKNRAIEIAAICDVSKSRRENAKRLIGGEAGEKNFSVYRDFRELLARRDIDAVAIAIGERWHAPASILAMRAGKDVYCETPGTLSIQEGRAVEECAKLYGAVYYSGVSLFTDPNFILCGELVRMGRIGGIKSFTTSLGSRYSLSLSHGWLSAQRQPDPETLDWEGWLGPSPWRPYNQGYLTGWRRYYDFSTSPIGEWGSRTLAFCLSLLPSSASQPLISHYASAPSKEGVSQRLGKEITFRQSPDGWSGRCGIRFSGTEGWLLCKEGSETPEASSPELLADSAKILKDFSLRRGMTARDSFEAFVHAVRGRGPSPAGPEIMQRAMTAVHASNIALELRRDVTFDPVKGIFIDDAEANRMISRSSRQGWQFC